MYQNNVYASVGLSNTSSLNIYGIDYGIDDYVIAGINDQKPRRYKIYSNNKGQYFNFGGCRYYLSEFILTNF